MMIFRSSKASVLRVSSTQMRLFSSVGKVLKLDVGGLKYTLLQEDVRKYPNSLFDKKLRKTTKGNCSLKISRNGELFRYVSEFLVSGHLPRDSSGRPELDYETIKALREEARFYELSSLHSECELVLANKDGVKTTEPISVVDFEAPVVTTLCKLWRPLIRQGELGIRKKVSFRRLFRKTSLARVDVDDLIAVAKRIPTNEPGRYKIGACMFHDETLEEIIDAMAVGSDVADMCAVLYAREMTIYTPESKKIHQHDSVQKGTVEIILNSAYTGGELQIVCEDQATEMKTGPFGWVAVHADASCTISPVTSGARVSLIYDIRGVYPTGGTSISEAHGEVTGPSRWDEIISDTSVDNGISWKLCRIAEMLQPAQVNQPILYIDPFFLNEKTIAKIPLSADLSILFPQKQLTFRPKHLAIHQATSSETVSHNYNTGRGKGYLGTLVVVLGCYFEYGGVNLRRRWEWSHPSEVGARRSWYAYGANTKHTLGSIRNGDRVSLEYDIYNADPENLPRVHNLFVHNEQPLLSRTRVSDELRAKVHAIVLAELAETEVVISLQHVYPDDVQPESLMGGDRALYDILIHTTDTAVGPFEVDFVKVTLKNEYDSKSKKNILVSCTYSYYADRTSGDTDTPPSATTGSAAAAAASTARLIIPTKLTEQHRAAAEAEGEEGKYCVSGLRVRVRQKK